MVKICGRCIIVQCIFLLFFNLSYALQTVEQWDRFELSLSYTANSNSFTNVQLSATFTGNDSSFVVAGFYDGDGIFKIRFMPPKTGKWQYTTKSNVPQLNNKKGSFDCVKATGDNHGMVSVSNLYNFKYADGKQYYPLGTTSYAWTHMDGNCRKQHFKP